MIRTVAVMEAVTVAVMEAVSAVGMAVAVEGSQCHVMVERQEQVGSTFGKHFKLV